MLIATLLLHGGVVAAGEDSQAPKAILDWVVEQQLLADDAATADNLGHAVAIDGDTVLVGTPRNDTTVGVDGGAAYVFVRTGSTWAQQAQLLPDGSTADARFGISVALSGDTALVGAFRDDLPGNNPDAGGAYVFVRESGVWTQQTRLIPSLAAANNHFGISVALDGDTALVGAPNVNTGPGFFTGAAFVFVRDAGVWTQQRMLSAGDGVADDQFGISVALEGDTALVGAWGDDGGMGSAHAFVRSGTTWTFQQKLTGTLPGDPGRFGQWLALSGDTALVGAPQDNTVPGVGAAYVFVRGGTTWAPPTRLLPAGGAAGDAFGLRVDIDGDIAVVAAANDDTDGGADAGSVHVFHRVDGGWEAQPILYADGASAGELFGLGVGVSGDRIAAGASMDDPPGGANAGSVFVFRDLVDLIFANGFETPDP